jgi:hypothetical protein
MSRPRRSPSGYFGSSNSSEPTADSASALHSGDPTFDGLPGHLMARLEPVLEPLLAAATATGEIRDDVVAKDLIHTVALLCQTIPGEELAYNQRMVAVFVDGLRRTADAAQSWSSAE